MPKHPPHLLELAKRGAEARLQDLLYEARLLVNLFPHLRDSFDPDELPVSFLLARGSRRGEGRGAGRPPRARARGKKAAGTDTAAPAPAAGSGRGNRAAAAPHC